MKELKALQQNVASLAAQLAVQASDLERWRLQVDDARYSAGDDVPLNLAARLQSTWQAHADDLNVLCRSLHASSHWR